MKPKKLLKKCGNLHVIFPPNYRFQREASFEFDEKMLAYLIDQSDTHAQRLRRADNRMPAVLSEAVPSNETVKTLCSARETFKLPSPTASESQC